MQSFHNKLCSNLYQLLKEFCPNVLLNSMCFLLSGIQSSWRKRFFIKTIEFILFSIIFHLWGRDNLKVIILVVPELFFHLSLPP